MKCSLCGGSTKQTKPRPFVIGGVAMECQMTMCDECWNDGFTDLVIAIEKVMGRMWLWGMTRQLDGSYKLARTP